MRREHKAACRPRPTCIREAHLLPETPPLLAGNTSHYDSGERPSERAGFVSVCCGAWHAPLSRRRVARPAPVTSAAAGWSNPHPAGPAGVCQRSRTFRPAAAGRCGHHCWHHRLVGRRPGGLGHPALVRFGTWERVHLHLHGARLPLPSDGAAADELGAYHPALAFACMHGRKFPSTLRTPCDAGG